MIIYNGIPFGSAPKDTLSESQIRDLVGAPTIEEELEAEARAERNECICGTVNCSTEYSCTTSGY
tara:strand:+ start:398 stop:592 length:195 start_codon:yes stop_codon:yes gene_type:complete